MTPIPSVASERHVDMSGARRVWAVGSVFGEACMLADLHDAIAAKFEAGDRFVYLGNVIGGDLSGPSDGCDVRATLAELIRFRAQVLAQPPLYLPDDIVCLRGSQEEMWHKLLQMHFAPKPKELLTWMLGRGVGATLAAYGGDAAQGFGAADEGMLALTRWTGRLKAAVQGTPGHQPWFNQIRRYAHTGLGGTLFVNAGIDPARALHDQRDAFWWGAGAFAQAEEAGFAGFAKVVRGFDPSGRGWAMTARTITVDTGCGRGGNLTAICLTPDGEVVDFVEILPQAPVLQVRAVR